MNIESSWLIHVTVDDGSDEGDFFVEIEDAGPNISEEIQIRSSGAMKFVCSNIKNATIWTPEGIEMLHEATGEYLRRAKEREE